MQIQEALTSQIADTIQEILKPKGVGVAIEAAHQCMTTRGVHKSGVSMVTMRTHGLFRDDTNPQRIHGHVNLEYSCLFISKLYFIT